MKIIDAVPKHGDCYPTVRAWMARLGVTNLDVRANEIIVDERTARLYIKAITPKTRVNVRILHGSIGRGSAAYITLDKNTLRAKMMTLGTVLHECAHALQNAKWHQRNSIRLEKRSAGKQLIGRNAIKAHGEAFCRTYAKLLREVLG